MTKTLILLRHLKSDWGNIALRDQDRPLAPRGEANGPRVQAALTARCPMPDVVMCSPAQRARQTLAHLIDAFPSADVAFVPAIYDASAATLRSLIADLPPSAQTVMFIGHNPGLLDLLYDLADRPEIGTSPIFRKFPTGSVVALEFDTPSWPQLKLHSGRIVTAFSPKQLIPTDNDTN